MKSLLFVCLGNICRSPSAEAVMKKVALDHGVDLHIDSAGTVAHHAGHSADSRMKRHAIQRGYNLTSISRPLVSDDYEEFDMIIGMDDANMQDLIERVPSPAALSRLSKMTDYCRAFEYDEVPDPYYGGSAGFELVLDLLEDACLGLLKEMGLAKS
jgi:protein-tyrosine phosphatase